MAGRQSRWEETGWGRGHSLVNPGLEIQHTLNYNLAANLEGPVTDQKAVWTPRRRSLGQRRQGDGRSLVQGSDLLPSSSLLLTESLKEFKCRTCVPVPAHVISRERD